MTFMGIDLGGGNVKAGAPDERGNPIVIPNDKAELFTPSVLYFDGDEILYGRDALNAGLVDGSKFVSGWKRRMGTSDVVHTAEDGTEYRARDIARLTLQKIAKDYQVRTGDVLEAVAVGVPSNYSDPAKEDTKVAVEKAGLRLIGLIQEPSAAALGNRLHERGSDGDMLIIDVGSTTTDVSVVRVKGKSIEILATSGVPELGGMDFNSRLQDMVLDELESTRNSRPNPQDHPILFQELFSRVEQAKVTLSARDKAGVMAPCDDGHVLTSTITREAFDKRTQDLVDQIMTCAETTAQEANVHPAEILLVGGGSELPAVKKAVKDRFGQDPAWHVEPHFACALGTTMYARMTLEQDGEQIQIGGRKIPPLDYRLQEVTAHAIGVATLDKQDQLINSVLLKKGQRIPSVHERRFQLAAKGQTDALIKVLQGPDGENIDDCQELGFFEFKDLKRISNRPHVITVRLGIDRNSILTATAEDAESGKSTDLTIKYHNA